MKDVNYVFICGRLGDQARMRPATNGSVQFTFSVATNTDKSDRDTPCWHKVMYWANGEKEIAFLESVLQKGVQVGVVGDLRAYHTSDGVKHIFVRARTCDILTYPVQDQQEQEPALDDEASLAAAFGDVNDNAPVPAVPPPKAPARAAAVPAPARSAVRPAGTRPAALSRPAVAPATGGLTPTAAAAGEISFD